MGGGAAVLPDQLPHPASARSGWGGVWGLTSSNLQWCPAAPAAAVQLLPPPLLLGTPQTSAWSPPPLPVVSAGVTPGYGDEVIFADGTFIDGSTAELSADGPIRPPYVVYCQVGMAVLPGGWRTARGGSVLRTVRAAHTEDRTECCLLQAWHGLTPYTSLAGRHPLDALGPCVGVGGGSDAAGGRGCWRQAVDAGMRSRRLVQQMRHRMLLCLEGAWPSDCFDCLVWCLFNCCPH